MNRGISCISFSHGLQEQYIYWHGRNCLNMDSGYVLCNNSAAGMQVTFYGTTLSMSCFSEYINEGFLMGNGYICVSIDDRKESKYNKISLPITSLKERKELTLCKGLEEKVHSVTVRKATEAWLSTWGIFSVETDGFFINKSSRGELQMEFYGDSIMAGKSADRARGENETDDATQENVMCSYGFQTARILNAQANFFCVSGARLGTGYNTKTDFNVSLPPLIEMCFPSQTNDYIWDFTNFIPKIVVIDLGTNDFISISSEESDFKEKFKLCYIRFLKKLRGKYPDSLIVICGGTFHYGDIMDITLFNDLLREVAEESKDDRIFYYIFSHQTEMGHPSREEAKEYALELATYLKNVMKTIC